MAIENWIKTPAESPKKGFVMCKNYPLISQVASLRTSVVAVNEQLAVSTAVGATSEGNSMSSLPVEGIE